MKRILLVEDDKILRRCLKGALEHEGYEVVDACSAEEAEEALFDPRVRLVVTDYQLGFGRSGLSLLVDMKARRCGVPVIVMSGWSDPSLGRLSKRLGASAFLEKPFPISLFLDECERSIREESEAPCATSQTSPLQ